VVGGSPDRRRSQRSLLGARGILPDFITVVAGNLFLIAGVCLFSIGTRRFFALNPRLPVFAGILVVMGLLLTWFTAVEPDYRTRLQLVSTLLAVIFARTRLADVPAQCRQLRLPLHPEHPPAAGRDISCRVP
jgi:hypothetical protein